MLTIIGHTNPDTDSICSAIICAHFLATVTGTPAVPAIAGPPNRETQFILDHFGIPAPEILTSLDGLTIALVDTNNPEELLPGWENATITGIVDHHKLVGGLSSSAPITVIIRPVACTATLLHDLYIEADTSIPREMAQLMLAAIISDTLNFSSPTTTNHDRQVAEQLAIQTSIHMNELAEQMFAAKSDLAGMSIEDIISVDSKVFTLADRRVMVGTHDTTNPANALALREELAAALAEHKQNEGFDYAFFFIIDILRAEATLITPSEGDAENAVADIAFGGYPTLPGIVSRKLQIIPKIDAALQAQSEK